jgi:hypothetical protein
MLVASETPASPRAATAHTTPAALRIRMADLKVELCEPLVTKKWTYPHRLGLVHEGFPSTSTARRHPCPGARFHCEDQSDSLRWHSHLREGRVGVD